MKIIFFGTPEFAVASLDEIINSEYKILAAVTTPDKIAGRGQKITESAVKKYAEKNNILTLQPKNLSNDDFITKLKALDADLFVVVAFRKLPEVVWQLPRMKTINLHGSLLPDYRGAAPINWAIINGEKKTGVSTFFINNKIDKGEIILKKEIPISFIDTAGSLHDNMMIVGAKLLIETIEKINNNSYKTIVQSSDDIKKASKIFKNDCEINFDQEATKIYNKIRGLSPYPTAYCTLKNKITQEKKSLKIYETKIIKEKNNKNIGEIISDNKNFLYIQCKDYQISLEEIKLEGKKKLTIKNFLAGFRNIENWTFITN